MALLLAVVFWTAHLLRVGYRLLQLYEIQTFYHNVLEIKDSELTSIPWKDVVQRICKRQPQVHLIVNQEQITPLDIYQRILRYKNYMVAFIDHVSLLKVLQYFMSLCFRMSCRFIFKFHFWAKFLTCPVACA